MMISNRWSTLLHSRSVMLVYNMIHAERNRSSIVPICSEKVSLKITRASLSYSMQIRLAPKKMLTFTTMNFCQTLIKTHTISHNLILIAPHSAALRLNIVLTMEDLLAIFEAIEKGTAIRLPYNWQVKTSLLQ